MTTDPVGAQATEVDVAIVGSGFGGLAAAHHLREQGIRDIVVLERADAVGGTWRDNHYPGAACDVPSQLYSLSFAPNPEWSHSFSRQPEIRAYLERVADDLDLRRHLRFRTELCEAHWDDHGHGWDLVTSTGRIRARALISAAGALSDASTPNVPGLADFDGEIFHSSRWRHDIDLRERRVAVVGTGASAIQFVPEIQPMVERLTILQRTPPWILPRSDRRITAAEKTLYRRFPALQRATRAAIYAGREAGVVTFLDPRWSRLSNRLARSHLKRSVPDPSLRERLTPSYTIGCKRILLSNDYYPAVSASNVEVISGLDRIHERGVVDTDGLTRSVDVIIFGTGFSVQQPIITERIRGAAGHTLAEHRHRGGGSMLGTTFTGFPNFFMILGPNTGLGHTSQVFMIERQAEYIARVLRAARRSGATRFEPIQRDEVAWGEEVDRRMASTVWTQGGCDSWYLDGDGNNTTLWPGSTLRFAQMAATSGLESFSLARR